MSSKPQPKQQPKQQPKPAGNIVSKPPVKLPPAKLPANKIPPAKLPPAKLPANKIPPAKTPPAKQPVKTPPVKKPAVAPATPPEIRSAGLPNGPRVQVTKSAIVAFLRLIESVNEKHSVLLISNGDTHSSCAVQEYNDALQSSSSTGLSQSQRDYAKFVDGLARKFDSRCEDEDAMEIPSMYSEEVLREAGSILTGVVKSGSLAGLL